MATAPAHLLQAPPSSAPLREPPAPGAASKRWRQLDSESRFELIERALKPANDRIDAFPLAL